MLDVIQVQNDIMEKKIDEMMQKLRGMGSPVENDMEKVIEGKGGRQAVLESEALLREVSKNELLRGDNKANGKPYTFEDLQDDLKADIDELLKKNMERFSRKITAQQQRLVEEIKDEVKRSSDRVITMFERGPHERLRDHVSDIYIIYMSY
jgi:Txe/YoeB family toxin of Txe-Axe toxin-antitoxin module